MTEDSVKDIIQSGNADMITLCGFHYTRLLLHTAYVKRDVTSLPAVAAATTAPVRLPSANT
jgi:hypothetical protein